tara:strand:+ start:724 stop:1185 length:462 start_codon:yes stop_codon:yes gene_type:complete
MSDPVISPDGKFKLINGEWIEILSLNEVSLNDSVVQGDINISSQVHHHHNEVIDNNLNLKICGNCGEEDVISVKCSGVLDLVVWESKKPCKTKGCEFCFKEFKNQHSNFKDKQFCMECYKINKSIISKSNYIIFLTLLMSLIAFVIWDVVLNS